jgi:pimeloyl-ACP methyl ester carboxylesterase
MKKLNLLPLIGILCFSSAVRAQPAINYGSNNGKYISILNTRIYYEEYGKGTPLLLLQGGMGSIHDFAKCIPELSKHFRVIAPDTPGQGRSELADSMSYPLLAEYMSRLIDGLTLDSTYVMGWSDGGIMGLILANKRPDKVKKVLASGANYKLAGAVPPHVNVDSLKPKPLAEWEIQNKQWIKNYMKILPRDWKKMRTDINKMWYQKVYFPASVLEGIKIPVMIVQGDRDQIMPEHGIEMHRLIKGSQFCILPGTSHDVFGERPDLINKIAIGFFK